jgi:hypothetical protein
VEAEPGDSVDLRWRRTKRIRPGHCLVPTFLAKTGVNFHGPGKDTLKIRGRPEYSPSGT